MQYIVIARDGSDSEALNRRLAVRSAHVELGNKLRDEGRHLYGVALLDSSEHMIGSVLVVDFYSREELDAWLKVEPYMTGKVWESVEILPCRVGPSFQR